MVLPPKHGLSLCAGGGGLDMGLELAEPSFTTACYVEIEEYPRECLIAGQRAGYLRTAPIWDDLKQFNARPWRGICDTLLAGYPCQPFSQAGQRKGEKDPRHLWPHIERIIEELDPRWCFFENVAGHITLGLDTVLRSLRRMGFVASVGLFSAEETGATHERQRVFIVAHRDTNADAGRVVERGYNSGAGRGEEEREQRERVRPRAGGSGIDCNGELANANGRNTGAEREQRGGEQRFHPESGGMGAKPVVHAERAERRQDTPAGNVTDRDHTGRNKTPSRAGEPSEGMGNPASVGRGERRAEPELWSGRDASASTGGEWADTLGNAGHQGGCGPRGDTAQGGTREADRASTPLASIPTAPPRPTDVDAWGAVLAVAPDLAPAISLGDVKRACDHYATLVEAGRMEEAEAERIVHRMASSHAQRPRALRLLGNAVHPLAAAYAWRSLSASHGLGAVDLDGTGGTAGTGTDGI